MYHSGGGGSNIFICSKPTAGYRWPLPRRDFRDFELKQSSALRAYGATILSEIDGDGVALDAGSSGVGCFGERVGRKDARGDPTPCLGNRLERCSAIRAHVVVAAVGCAAIEHILRAADRTRDFQFSGAHPYCLGAVGAGAAVPKNSGSMTTGLFF